MKCWQQAALFVVCSIGFVNGALANLTFDGTLVEPPACLINSGSTIEIDFQNVSTKKVDGVNYREPVNYTITCAGDTLPWEMQLVVEGLATTFESSALQTRVPDLGVQLLQNGAPLLLNTPLLINPAAPPVLEAVPVQRPGASLDQGEFTASATLLVWFQ